MNIAWCTPLGAESAIAEYSVELCAALAAESSVEIWAADARPWRDAPVPVVDFSDGDVAELSRYDVVVYNLGDHCGYHRVVYEALLTQPGVCVLHDRVYQSLFASMWLSKPGGHELYADRMGEFYGQDGRRSAEDSFLDRRSPLWESERDWLRFPLDDEAITNAVGVIVHAEDHAAQLRKKWLGPVTRIRFPTYAKHWIDDDEAGAAPIRDSLTLLTLGYINPNKQVHRVIEAIERDDVLRSRVRYVVAGPTDLEGSYFQSIERLVATGAMEGIVTLLPGYQPESVVEEWLRRADVYVNLREPSLESASASLMRQLPRGKAVLVSNSGFYAEFEDDVLMKVAPGDDAALRRALRRLVDDFELRRRLGARAREVARERTVQRAARDILTFLREDVAWWRPQLALVDRVATELGTFGVDREAAVIREVSGEVATIIGP